MKELILEDKNKDISLDEIKIFLNEFSLKLPKSYVDFIWNHNGGYPSLSAYGNPYEDGVAIEVFCCLDPDYDRKKYIPGKLISVNDIIDSHQVLEKNLPPYLFPFGLDAGGGYFCISTKKDDFGEIYMFYMDGTCEEPVYLCDSFEEFINNLEDLQIYSEEEDY